MKTLIFKGIELKVEYEYFAGSIGNYEDPPENAHVEIEKIMCVNADLTPMFEAMDSLMVELEEEILSI